MPHRRSPKGREKRRQRSEEHQRYEEERREVQTTCTWEPLPGLPYPHHREQINHLGALDFFFQGEVLRDGVNRGTFQRFWR